MASTLCPRCRKLISADEPQCPYCHLSRPGSPWVRLLGSLGRSEPDALVRHVIIFTVAVYVLSLLVGAGTPRGRGPLGLLSPSDSGLLLLGATGTLPVFTLGRWWTLLAATFLHGGPLHLAFNMMALAQIGPLILREYGVHRAAALYVVGGALGFFVSVLAGVRFTIGASAAVCAFIGAALYYGRSRGGVHGEAVYRGVLGWAAGIFVFGFFLPGINNWAHGGGMAAGFALGWLLGYEEAGRERPWHWRLGVASVVAALAAVGWGAVSALFYRLAA